TSGDSGSAVAAGGFHRHSEGWPASIDDRYQSPSSSGYAARIDRAHAWVRSLGPLLIACEAPALVGQRPERSSSRRVRRGRNTTRCGARVLLSTVDVAWKTSATQVRTDSEKYSTPCSRVIAGPPWESGWCGSKRACGNGPA